MVVLPLTIAYSRPDLKFAAQLILALYFLGSGFCGVVSGLFLLIAGIRRFRVAPAFRKQHEAPSSFRLVEDRLDELERLKRRDMVTLEEYATKRQEILKDL